MSEHVIYVTLAAHDEATAIMACDRLKDSMDVPTGCRVVDLAVRPAELEEGFDELPGHDVSLTMLKIKQKVAPSLEELDDLRLAFLQAKRVADAASGQELAILNMVYDPIKGFSTGMSHWAVRLIATHLAKTLKDGGGINYLELDMVPCELEGERIGPLTLRIQRKEGKSPGQINSELKEELAKLRAEIATLKGEGEA